MESCGPFSASTAAAWLIEDGLVVDWLCSLSIALMSGTGAPAKPMRQPVIAYDLEQPFIVTVRARRRGSTSRIVAGLNPS
jgi:hypothetical protein